MAGAGLPATPWLQPADPAQHFMQAYQAGAQISEANARMQQQAQQTSVELEMRQREHQQQSLMEQQRMEIEKNYHQSQLAMQQQKLQEAAKVNDMKIQSAARQMQARAAYQQDLANNPSDIYGAISRNPEAFGSGFGASLRGAAALKNQASVPSLAEKTDMGLDADTYEKLEAAKLKLQEQLPLANAKTIPQFKSQITELTRQQNAIRQNRGLTRPQVPPGMQAPGQPAEPRQSAGATDPGKIKVLSIRPAGAKAPSAPEASGGVGQIPDEKGAMPDVQASVPAPQGKTGLSDIASDTVLNAAGSALRNPLGKSLADLYEGIGGMADIPAEEVTGFRKRIKQLREDILSATSPESEDQE